jgi:hypothetical protein
LDALVNIFALASSTVALEDEVGNETFGVTLASASFELDLQRET